MRVLVAILLSLPFIGAAQSISVGMSPTVTIPFGSVAEETSAGPGGVLSGHWWFEDKRVLVGAQLGYQGLTYKAGDGAGSYGMLTFLPGARYIHAYPEYGFRPYVGAGLGLMNFRGFDNVNFDGASTATRLSEVIFAAKVEGGLQLMFDPHFGFDFGAHFLTGVGSGPHGTILSVGAHIGFVLYFEPGGRW